jgi:hypothetical protein
MNSWTICLLIMTAATAHASLVTKTRAVEGGTCHASVAKETVAHMEQ